MRAHKTIPATVLILLLVVMATAANHPDYPSFSASESFSLAGNTLSASDTIIFRTAYYASDGDNRWTPLSLSGPSFPDNDMWIMGRASYSLPPFDNGEHYVLVYACSQIGTTADVDCHGGWQLKVVNNAIEAAGNSFSLSAWVTVNSAGNVGKIMVKPTDFYDDPWEVYALDVANGDVRFILSDGTPAGWHNVNASIPLGEEHLIVGTYDGTTMRLYLDGSLEDSKAVSLHVASSNEDLSIGRYPTCCALDGTVRDATVHDRVLTGEDIAALYGDEPLPACASGETLMEACLIANGDGERTSTCTDGRWSPWSDCVVTSCDTANGYVKSGNSCIEEPTDPSGDDLHRLVIDGIAQSQIIVAPDAPPMVAIAAEELQYHLQKMSGATLPIRTSVDASLPFRIYIGRSANTDQLGVTAQGTMHGGFKMATGDDYLVLIGDDTELTYGDDYSSSTVPNGLGQYWKNLFRAWDRHYNDDYDVWDTDGKGSLNAVYELLYDLGVRHYYPGEIGEVIPRRSTVTITGYDKTVNPDFAKRTPYQYYQHYSYVDEQGLKWRLRLRTNQGETSIGPFLSHGILQVIDDDSMKSAHPEYYAIWGGVRQNGDYPKPDLCSEALRQEHLRYVRHMFDTHPELPSISIAPVDGFIRVSESSPACEAMATPERGYEGQISDYVWEYMNNLAWDVYEEYPDKKLNCLAYTAYLLPPQELSRPLAPNLAIIFARWRTWMIEPEREALLKGALEDWLDILPSKEAYIWDYYLHNRLDRATESYPVVFPHLIADDLRYMEGKSNGEYIEIVTTWRGWDDVDWDLLAANALNLWVTARMYWDVDQDIDALLDEYYDLFYGPASAEMKHFYEYAEAHFDEAAEDPQHLVTLRNIAEDARAKAGSTIYGERIDLLLGLMNSRYVGEETTISSCQTLDSPSTTYRLTKDVSSNGACFHIYADGVTLDCQGHTITFSGAGGDDDHAIYANERLTDRGDYFTIRNCNIRGGAGADAAIYLNLADHGLVENVDIDVPGDGIRLYNGVENTFRANTVRTGSGEAMYTQFGSSEGSDTITRLVFEDSTFISSGNRGAYLYRNKQDVIRNNEFRSADDYGLYLFAHEDTLVEGNTIVSGSGNALSTYRSSGLTLVDNTIVDG